MMVTALVAILAASWSGTLSFSAPEIDPRGFPVIAGTVNLNQPGVPAYPVKTIFIPVPPGAEPQLTYRVSSDAAVAETYEIPRVGELSGRGLNVEETPTAPVDFTVRPAVLEGIIPLAGATVAVVDIYPLTERGFFPEVNVSLEWQTGGSGTRIPENSLLYRVAEGDVYWPVERLRASSPFWGKPWAKISVLDTGCYEVTCSELESAGCAAGGVPIESVALFSGPGTQFAQSPETEHSLLPVPVIVDDKNNDGVFNGNDVVRFIAGGLNRFEYTAGSLQWLYHRYAKERVYWLTWGGVSGAEMQSVSGVPDTSPGWGATVPHTVHLEDGGYWLPQYELRTGWFWKKVHSGESLSVPLSLENIAGNADITVVFAVTESSPYTLTLHGSGTLGFSGSGTEQALFQNVDISSLDHLQLSFSSEDQSADFYLDYIDVAFPVYTEASSERLFFPGRSGRYTFSFQGGKEAFDVSDLMNPLRIDGAEDTGGSLNFSLDLRDSTSLMVVSNKDWKSPSAVSPASPGRLVGTITSGDRLFVVPDEFSDDAVGFVSLMETMGLNVVTATTSEIYDEFGQGVKDPGAIRSAVRWAIDSWSEPPGALILGGDANYDPLGYSTTLPDLVPGMIHLVNSSGYPAWADEDWFVEVHASSVLPEIPVARIPAGNATSFGAVSAKSSLYYSGQADGAWSSRFVLFADDEWGPGGIASESVHTRDMETICYHYLPNHAKPEKFYLIEYPWPPGTVPGGVHPEKPQAREDFMELWDRGMGAMLYFGHGSANQLAHEKVMLGDDPASLTNGARLPLAMFLSCDVSRFFVPGVDCISEKLVYHPAGGAIATIGATGGTYSSSNLSYAEAMIPFLTNSANSIGFAFWAGKITAYRAGSSKYYVLLGLPDLVLPMAESHMAVELHGDTLRSGESNTVTGAGESADGLALVEISESDTPTHYTMLSGGIIDYFRQGGTAWRGRATISGGVFSAECIIPSSSNAGDLARVDAAGVVSGAAELGADAPVSLVEGDIPSDFDGPDVTMWIKGQPGVDEPVITGEGTVAAELSDSSGINFLGGTGRSIQLFVDGDEFDLSRAFTYNTGSTTTGRLEYTVYGLSTGRHLFLLQAMDGVGNQSRDSLYVTSTDQKDVAIEQHIVYPNPGKGRRCFSFTVSSEAFVTVSIYTTTGRRIAELTRQCAQGYNQIVWDGRDSDGDFPATGAYIYLIEAETEDGMFKQSSVARGVFAIVN